MGSNKDISYENGKRKSKLSEFLKGRVPLIF